MRQETSTKKKGPRAWQLLVLLTVALAAASLPLVLPAEASGDPLEGAGDESGVLHRGIEPDFVFVPDQESPKEVAKFEATENGQPRVERPATSGTLEGVLVLDEKLIGRLSVYQVQLEEAVNDNLPPNMTRKPMRTIHSFSLEPKQVSAQFAIHDLPFSEYGWRVSVSSPGLSGSEQIVALTSKRPSAKVLLTLKRPIPVTIAVKDQLKLGIAKLPVMLRPKGRPLGRTLHQGETDPYGHIHFPDVVRGTYELVVGRYESPLAKVRTIEVPDTRKDFFIPVEVPRGSRVTFHVNAPGGYGLAGVEVEASDVESKVYRKYKQTSDRFGKVELPHLPKGVYYVHFTKKGYQRGFKKITVTGQGDVEEHVTLKLQR